MIAHRLSTVKNCDRLYLMQAGKIVCSGTYNELLPQSNEFKSLAQQESNDQEYPNIPYPY
jgi:ABC-type multidrug transport system fused ATPase/permease subunit